jgi:hypothetical protein
MTMQASATAVTKTRFMSNLWINCPQHKVRRGAAARFLNER